MASADIDGFRIRIDDTLARDISKVDKALQNIEVHGAAAGQALMNFKAGLAGMRGFEGDVGAVADYLERIKAAMKSMPTKTLERVASSMSSITQEINNLNTDKLSTAFRAAETPATGIVQKVADLVNSLAQIPEQVRAAMSGVSKPIAIETKDEKTNVRTEKQTNEQHSLEQINANLKQREQEMQRLVDLQNALTAATAKETEAEQKQKRHLAEIKAQEEQIDKLKQQAASKRTAQQSTLDRLVDAERVKEGLSHVYDFQAQVFKKYEDIRTLQDFIIKQAAKIARPTTINGKDGYDLDPAQTEKLVAAIAKKYQTSILEAEKILRGAFTGKDSLFSGQFFTQFGQYQTIIEKNADAIKKFAADKRAATQELKIAEEANLKAAEQSIAADNAYRQAEEKLNATKTQSIAIDKELTEARKKVTETAQTFSSAGGEKRIADLDREIANEKQKLELEKKQSAELEKQKNLQKQTEAKGTTTSGQVDVSVKFNEQALLTALKDISVKLETLFKDIPVSLKKELDLSFFEQKAKELKQMFEGITVPVPKASGVTTTEGVKHEAKADTAIAPTNAEINVKINEKSLGDAKALIEELQQSLQALIEKVGGLPMIADTAFSRMSNGLKDVKRDVDSLKESFGLLDMKNIGFAKTRVVLPNKKYFEAANELMELEQKSEKAQKALEKLESEFAKVKAAEDVAASGGIVDKFKGFLATISEGDEARSSSVIQKEIDGIKQYITELNEAEAAIRKKMETSKKSGSISSDIVSTEKKSAEESKKASEETAKATERNIAGLRAEIKERKEALQEGAGITRADNKQQAAVDALARSKAELKQQEMSLTEQLKQQYQELLKLDKIHEKLTTRKELHTATGGKSGGLTEQEAELLTQVEARRKEINALIAASPALLEKEGVELSKNHDFELQRLRAENERWKLEQQKRYEDKPTAKKKDTTEEDKEKKEKELLSLLKERLKVQEKIESLVQKDLNKKNGLNTEEGRLLAGLGDKADKLDAEIKKLNSEYTTFYEEATKNEKILVEYLEAQVRLRKELDAMLKAKEKPEKSAEEVRIENLVKEYKSILSQMQTIEKAQAQANKTLDDKNATQGEKDRAQKILNDTTLVYEQLAKRRIEIEQETDEKIVALRNKAAATMAKAEAQRLKQEQKDREQKAQIDPTAAIEYAKNAKSINDLQTALKNLKKVMGDAVPNKGEWKELNKTYQETKKRLDNIQKSMEGIKTHSFNLIPTLNNLAMQFGIMFSVQQLMDWTKHMVEVRAQFELQQIALRSIIQDKQKADEVFAQVQQLALKSPFSIMQLNTYTKQIAAYGVEAGKLVGTTKELADVSAGLGVDMGRLILAYGQVKTANYLRATEVRQFTEAGLNITQELANYFTELNGKMVTAGEVTEMITKRMVKFEDVAEVFHRVTSAGGMFYDMQEKQAEGLHGQMQRIGDAYSIMLNTIGKNNDSVIAKVLSTIRELIQNWRTVANVISPVVAAMTSYFIAAKAAAATVAITAALAAAWRKVAIALNIATEAQIANNVATKANPYAVILSVVTLLGVAIYEVCTATDQLTEDLKRMEEETAVEATDAVARFRELADIVRDTSKSYEERKSAMEELHRAYGDILPAEKLEIENIRAITDNYEEASRAIREYYRIKLEEEQKSQIESTYATDFASESKGIVEDMTDVLADKGGSKQAIQGIINTVIEELKEDSIKTAEDAGEKFAQRLIKYYNITDEKLQNKIRETTLDSDLIGGGATSSKFEDLRKKAEDYRTAIAGVSAETETFSNITEEKEAKALKKINAQFDEQKKKVEALSVALSALQQIRVTQERSGNTNTDLSKWLDAMTPTDKEQTEKLLLDIGKAYADVGEEGKHSNEEIFKAVANNITLHELLSATTKRVYTSLVSDLRKTKDEANALAKTKAIQNIQAEIEKVDGSPAVREIRKIVKSVADANKLDYHLFDWLTLDVKTSFASARKEFETQKKDFHEKVLQWKTIMSTLMISGKTKKELEKYAEQVTGLTTEQFNKRDVIEKALGQDWNLLGGHDKEKKNKEDKTEQLLRNRVNLLKEANQMYEKLNKEYGKDISYQQTYNNLLARAKELGIKDIFDKDTFTNKSTLAAMEALYNKAGAGFNYFTKEFRNKYGNAINELLKEIGEQKYQLAVDINKESREKINRQLDEMFGKYDLYVELNKEGVDSDIIKSLFDIDKTSITEIYDEFNKMVLNSANEAMRQKEADFKGFSSIEQAKAKLGTEYNKMYADNENKLTDRLEKEYETRMKSYLKYIKKSYSDAAQAQISEYSQLSELAQIMSLQKAAVYKRTDFVSEDERNAIIKRINEEFITITNAVRKESKEALDNALFQQFKEDPIFEELFGDLSLVSTKIIDVLYDKIEDLKGSLENLDPKKVKELVRLQQQLFAVKAERNPFKAYFESLKKVRDLRKELKDEGISDPTLTLVNKETELNAINSTIDGLDVLIDLQKKRVELNKQVADLSEKGKTYLSTDENVLLTSLTEKEMAANKLEERKETEKLNSEELDRLSTLKEEIRLIQKVLSLKFNISSQTKQENKELKNSPYKDIYQTLNEAQLLAEKTGQTKKAEEIKDLISKLKEYTDAEEDSASAGKKLGSTINAMADTANKGIDVWIAGMEMIGHSLTESERLWFSFSQQALTSIASITAGIISGEIALNSASGIIGIIATALSLIAGLFTTIFGAHDARLQEQIEETQRQVNKLQRSFDDLKDSIDNAFTGLQLGQGTQASIQNLKEQNEEYQKMIALEEDKKNADQDKLIEYRNNMEDNTKKIRELQQEYITTLGGLGSGSDVLNAAQDFVDAWGDAFAETGDGLSGLKEDFDDFMRNIVKKQAYMKVADHWIDRFGKMINDSFDQYGQVNYEKLRTAMDWFTQVGMPQIDSFLQDFEGVMNDMGLTLLGSNSELSGLAAGIQGVTEETAQVIEAMLNSMRFYVADTNKELKNIVMTLTNPPSDNVFLSELKAQTAQLEMLNKTLNGLVRAGHRMGGHGLKVFTN